jgi:hypothetical protein
MNQSSIARINLLSDVCRRYITGLQSVTVHAFVHHYPQKLNALALGITWLEYIIGRTSRSQAHKQ